MKVLYLLNRVRSGNSEVVRDDHLYGMLRLPAHGIEAGYVELEQYLPKRLARFIREHLLNIYWVHLPFFPKFFAYDAVFTSTAFVSQLLHTLYPFKKPKWIMLDFGLIDMLGQGKTLKQKLLSYLVSRADGIVAIDAAEKRALEERFPILKGKVVFLHFAVDTEYFKPRPEVAEEPFIFSPGRDPGRDFKTLFAAVHDTGTRVVLTARPGNIKKLLPLPAGVTNADFSPEEYVEALAKAYLVVIPLDTRSGINTAMGTSSLVEAMAMGKAVIATRTPTTESYIEHGVNGLLVPPQDPQALQDAILTLLREPERRAELGAAARAFAVAECSADRFAVALAAYLKSVVK